MSDPFRSHASGLSSPAYDLFEIAPDDGADLATYVRGLSVTGSGNVRVTTVGGSTATIHIAAGAPFPVRARRVWATGTDATGLVGIV